MNTCNNELTPKPNNPAKSTGEFASVVASVPPVKAPTNKTDGPSSAAGKDSAIDRPYKAAT